MTKRVSSHPHLFLSEHIEQINKAIYGIWNWHSPQTITPSIVNTLQKLVLLHDLGKGTTAFQEYIINPADYRGARDEKSHTTLSLVLTIAKAIDENWEELETFALAAAAKGHHGRLPTVPERTFDGASCPEWDIDSFAGGAKAKLIKKQLNMINYPGIAAETGIDLQIIAQLTANDDFTRLLIRLKKYLTNNIISKLLSLPEKEAVDFRLKAQLIFSIFLEADKAFLAVSEPTHYLKREERHWQVQWVNRYIGDPPDTKTNRLRLRVRDDVLKVMEQNKTDRIYSLTAPTGSGKTLLAATWAFSLREKSLPNPPPRIIIVLPFLSIIDQTIKDYMKLLQTGGYEADGAWLLTSHSLSDRHYAEWIEKEDESFFVDTWRSELIITTYDQFLMSLMDPGAKYQMRFHNLCDALIVMDEVQSLPCKLWRPLEKILNSLAAIGNSKILLMSATLPPFVKNVVPLLPAYEKYFSQFKRYKLLFRLKDELNTTSLCEELEKRLPTWSKQKERVLITLNTRRSARIVRDALVDMIGKEHNLPVHFVSADVTPLDRLETIGKIKEGRPCIVVSTQCIEAGVDIDMGQVIRDFAPLDNLIQIAGRCNREGKKDRCQIEVIDLTDEDGNRYSEMIYDPVHLQVTRELIRNITEMPEENVLDLSNRYFNQLLDKKDTGKIHLKRFARWQDDLPAHELLRGKKHRQHTFLVIEEDPSLQEEMAKANSIADRWKRREAWRKLAGRIAMVSVSIYANPHFQPQQIANEYLGHWLLREGYYSSDRGLLVEGTTCII